ncbi:hypothetical protein M2322_003876 [Rhodoblastus acidophilus]|uniref:hypothetical protein n=1 Tax=Rhodoblastus acidophilus TaxID=1074 RepID=UPI0022251B39|nr:hypothetical protein [Rhodoblastus acidophilus]MCW2318309.1 hypothetical protein [Rhodoblastus acidophilus]
MANLSSTMTVKLVDDVSKPARTVAQALKDAERAAKEVARGMAGTGATDRLQKSLSKLSLSKKDIEQVAGAWRDYSRAAGLAANSASWTKAQAASVRSWETQTVNALRAVKREQVAFQRSLRNQGLPALPAVLPPRQRGGHRGALSTLAGNAGLDLAAGAGAERTAHTMVHKAAEVEQLRFRVRELSRNDPTEAPFADKLASEIAARYPGIGLDKALDTYIETRANSVDHHGRVDQNLARRNMLAASRAQNAALALGIEMTPTDLQNLLKGVEGSGRADDPKAVEKITDAYIRAKQVFGSAIASAMVRDYTANAKAANFSIGDEQFFRENLVRMSEGNASRLGNEVNQSLASLKGSMKKSAGKWLIEHGLAKAEDMENMGGGAVRFKHGPENSALLETNQGEWARTVLRDAIARKGVLNEDKVQSRMKLLRDQELAKNPNAEIDEHYLRHRAAEGLISADLATSGFRSTVIDNLAHLIGNELLMDRDVQAMNNASGTKAGDRIAENPIATWTELTTSLQTFASVVGSPALQAASSTLDGMSRGIASFSQSLAEWEKANPTLAKIGSGGAIAGMGAGGAALLYGAFNGLASGFGLKGSAVALDASAAALTAAAGRLGATPGVLPNPGAATPGLAAPAIVGAAGGVAGGAIAGGVLAGIGASALTAGAILDSQHADAPGHKPWTVDRLLGNFLGGQDYAPNSEEIGASVENSDKTWHDQWRYRTWRNQLNAMNQRNPLAQDPAKTWTPGADKAPTPPARPAGLEAFKEAAQDARQTLQLLSKEQVAPHVDSQQIDLAKDKAAGALQTLQLLGHETVKPNVDTQSLDNAKDKAGEAHKSLLQINGSFSPQISTAALDALIIKARKARAELRKLSAVAASPGAGEAPSFGSLHRNSFTTGPQGE